MKTSHSRSHMKLSMERDAFGWKVSMESDMGYLSASSESSIGSLRELWRKAEGNPVLRQHIYVVATASKSFLAWLETLGPLEGGL